MQHLTRLTGSSSFLKLFPFSASFISPAPAPLGFLRGLPLLLLPPFDVVLLGDLLMYSSHSLSSGFLSQPVRAPVKFSGSRLLSQTPAPGPYVLKPLGDLPPPIWRSHYNDPYHSFCSPASNSLQFHGAVFSFHRLVWRMLASHPRTAYTFPITLGKGYFLFTFRAFG